MNKHNNFPRTEVAGISLPRLIIGCNWISGFSHTTPSKDEQILRKHHAPESTAAVFETFLKEDVNACLGLFDVDKHLLKAVRLAEERTGKTMIMMDEPVLNVDDTAMARRESEQIIKECACHKYIILLLENQRRPGFC